MANKLSHFPKFLPEDCGFLKRPQERSRLHLPGLGALRGSLWLRPHLSLQGAATTEAADYQESQLRWRSLLWQTLLCVSVSRHWLGFKIHSANELMLRPWQDCWHSISKRSSENTRQKHIKHLRYKVQQLPLLNCKNSRLICRGSGRPQRKEERFLLCR